MKVLKKSFKNLMQKIQKEKRQELALSLFSLFSTVRHKQELLISC